jgi:hypothetical protein
MRRQTILLAAALAVATPGAALTEGRNAAREAARAIQTPQRPTPQDRFVLKIDDAKAASSSIGPVDDASLVFQLAEARKRRHAVASGTSQRLDIDTNAGAPSPGDAATAASSPAKQGGADSAALETAGFKAHQGVSSAHEFAEEREPVSLNVVPVTAQRHRDGDWETLRADDTADDAEVSGVAVGLSFKLN